MYVCIDVCAEVCLHPHGHSALLLEPPYDVWH